MTKFSKNPSENETEYIYRVCSNKEEIGSWIDVAKLLNKELGYDYTESKYRKDYNLFQRSKEFFANDLSDEDRYISELKHQRQELEKERNKLRTEKLEYAKMLREEARDEMIISQIASAIRDIKPLDKPNPVLRADSFDTGWILAFGDEHYGAEFDIKGFNGETINKYNPEIFENRMWNLLDNVCKILQKENVGTLHVFSLGDFADGILRVGQLVKLAYGVVDATVNYMEFMANWLNELTRFCHVKFYMTDGNHSELRMFNQPKGTFKDENMGKIVRSYIIGRLSTNDRFELIYNDTGYIYTNLFGYNIVGVHGEAKDMEKELLSLSNIYNMNVDYLFGGHLHHFESRTVGINRGTIRVPSIVGVDGYSMDLRKASEPGAIICGFTDSIGKTVEYHINLR